MNDFKALIVVIIADYHEKHNGKISGTARCKECKRFFIFNDCNQAPTWCDTCLEAKALAFVQFHPTLTT